MMYQKAQQLNICVLRSLTLINRGHLQSYVFPFFTAKGQHTTVLALETV